MLLLMEVTVEPPAPVGFRRRILKLGHGHFKFMFNRAREANEKFVKFEGVSIQSKKLKQYWGMCPDVKVGGSRV